MVRFSVTFRNLIDFARGGIRLLGVDARARGPHSLRGGALVKVHGVVGSQSARPCGHRSTGVAPNEWPLVSHAGVKNNVCVASVMTN